jgi:hypothetical protein
METPTANDAGTSTSPQKRQSEDAAAVTLGNLPLYCAERAHRRLLAALTNIDKVYLEYIFWGSLSAAANGPHLGAGTTLGTSIDISAALDWPLHIKL